MIEYLIKLNQKQELQKIQKYKPNCWINVNNPSKQEIDFLVENFNLEKDLILDGLDIHEIPRIEEENNKAYIYLTIPTTKITNEYTSSFLIIISKNILITISNSELEIIDKIKNFKNFLTNKKTRSLLQILLFLSNSFSVKIRNILKEVKKDRRNIKNLNDKDILDLVIQEDILNDYLASFSPLIHMHAMMLKLKSIKFIEDEKEVIEDLIVDLNQTLMSCKSALKTISNMRDYYQTTISNNLNKILKILTIFTVFLTIPAVIGGIYGMNIQLPAQNTKNIFWVLSGLTIGIWGITLILFKKSRIL